jgi:hypothetical protein
MDEDIKRFLRWFAEHRGQDMIVQNGVVRGYKPSCMLRSTECCPDYYDLGELAQVLTKLIE